MQRRAWTRASVLAVAFGAVAGAGVRWGVLTTMAPATGFPWRVFWINVLGSGALGVVLAEEWRHPGHRLILHDAAGIGFCGGLTTFSTYAVEITDLLRDERVVLAVGYGVGSVGASLLAAVVGAASLRRVRALSLPLEEEP